MGRDAYHTQAGFPVVGWTNGETPTPGEGADEPGAMREEIPDSLGKVVPWRGRWRFAHLLIGVDHHRTVQQTMLLTFRIRSRYIPPREGSGVGSSFRFEWACCGDSHLQICGVVPRLSRTPQDAGRSANIYYSDCDGAPNSLQRIR